jgi:topoisomerase-4 subunit B
VPKKRTGTTLRFWPEAKYFDSPKISLSKLKHLLRAKAVLCAGLTSSSPTKPAAKSASGTTKTACAITCAANSTAPKRCRRLFVHHMARDVEGMDVALAWLPEGELVQESYVNLIPTAQGGTHVNGLRTGLTTPSASSATSATCCRAA